MATDLTPDEMKQRVASHFEEFVNKKNAAVIHENMSPEFYDHDGPGGSPTGVLGDEQMMRTMYARMPNLHLTVEQMIAEGDTVVCRNTWRWTDASGVNMQFHGFVQWRFEGEKIAERWATVSAPSAADSWKRMSDSGGRRGIVALCGATGRSGSRILDELLSRGHTVLAIVRESGRLSPREGMTIVIDDLSSAERLAALLQGCLVLISAYAPPPDDAEELIAVTHRLVSAVSIAGVGRFLMVGGAGSLEVSPGQTLLASGQLPPAWEALAVAHGHALEVLRASSIQWTSLSPAAYFDPGTRKGVFRVGGDELMVDAEGKSTISMEDYALAMVDELERPKHPQQRFSVAY